MTNDLFASDSDIVPIADAGGDEPGRSFAEEQSVMPDIASPPLEAFTPKEIQTHVFGAAVQIYNTRADRNDYESQKQAVFEAATLFAIAANTDVIGEIFERIAQTNGHSYDVYARAEQELRAMFAPQAGV